MILIVEDDLIIAEGIQKTLENADYPSFCVHDKKSALMQIKLQTFELAILDLTLPDGNGYEICEYLKQKQPEARVIFLTALDDETHVVKGFELGGDDYITKPFRLKELVARVGAVLRRGDKQASHQIEFHHLKIDTKKAEVYKNGELLAFTALEYRLLSYMITNRNQILSREQLLESIWDISGDFVNDNTLTVYIKRLREKIEVDASNPTIIKTMRGLGYLVE